MLPRRLGVNILERDVNRLKSWTSDLSGFTMTDPFVTRNIEPESGNLYDIGTADKQYKSLFLYYGLSICDTAIIVDNGSAASPYLYIETPAPSGTDRGTIYLRARGDSGHSSIRIWGDGAANYPQIAFKVGAGWSGTTNYNFNEGSVSFYEPLQIHSGLSVTGPSLSSFAEDCEIAGYWRSSDPAGPTVNGEWSMWLSDGGGTGAAGDMIMQVRTGGATRTFTLVSHAAGAGNSSIDEYLYHAGDADTYLRFQDDQGALAAGGVTFMEWIEAAQDIIHFNSADADVDFQVDTVLGDGSLFVEGSTGRVGVNLITGLTGLVHVNQNAAAGAIPVVHLEQDDVSEEFVRFTGTAAAATLTNSLVAEADVSTATRIGFVKINIQDEGDQITDGAAFIAAYTLA